jgi:hypothetical protein
MKQLSEMTVDEMAMGKMMKQLSEMTVDEITDQMKCQYFENDCRYNDFRGNDMRHRMFTRKKDCPESNFSSALRNCQK